MKAGSAHGQAGLLRGARRCERRERGGPEERPIRKLAMEHHPDRNPATRRPSSKFKEINEAYESSRIRRSAPPTTASAMPPSSGGGGAAAAAGPASTSPAASPTSSTTCSAIHGRPARRRSGRAASAAPTCATTWRSRSRRPTPASRRDPRADRVTCETCTGTGAKAGTKPATCPTCRGPARCGRRRASSPSSAPARLPWRGPDHRGSLPRLRRPGRVRKERTLSVNIPAGRRGRHAHPARRRGRGRPRGGAAGRPLHLPVGQAAPTVPARRRRHLLPRADPDDHRGARRRRSRCRPSTAAGRA